MRVYNLHVRVFVCVYAHTCASVLVVWPLTHHHFWSQTVAGCLKFWQKKTKKTKKHKKTDKRCYLNCPCVSLLNCFCLNPAVVDCRREDLQLLLAGQMYDTSPLRSITPDLAQVGVNCNGSRYYTQSGIPGTMTNFTCRSTMWEFEGSSVTMAPSCRKCEQTSQWGLCALRHGIQISMEAILACHPEWLDCHPKSCELWRIRTGPIVCRVGYTQ